MGEPARGRTGELLEHELGKRGQTPGENARKTQKCQRQEDLRRSQPLRLTPRLLQRVPSLESSAKKPSSPRWQASRKSCETKPSTSLANAVSSGDLEAVRLLLWDGRSSDLLNEAEPGTLFTPLHTASRAGDLGVVQLLLEAGAYVNVHDSEGLTPLHHATNHEHEEVVAALLGANANPNLGTAALYTPVHFACRLGNIQLLRALLLHRGRKDLKTKDAKSTPLHLAVLSRNPDVLACLLGVGDTAFDIDATDRNGYTALQRSCQAGSERMVRDLVLAGASRHYRGKWDWTALHWAANSGHADVVATLLELGANQGIEDNDGNIAYDVATTEEVRGLLDPDVSRITARMSITNSRDPSEVTCSGLEDDDASRRWSCPASPARWSLPVSPSGHSFFSPRKSKLLSLLSPPNRASISSPRSPCQSFAASPR